jgi:hypothetical protein
MNSSADKQTFQERYQHLLELISSERFLKNQGLNNEVPFYICPFHAEEAVDMERIQKQLKNKLEQSGITVLAINLYDFSIQLLKDRNIWDRIIQTEQSTPKVQLLELLQGVLDLETHLIPAISRLMAENEFDVMFISGVGEVFPYIRSHNVLNNLQKSAKDKPTVMFFPGDYTHSLADGASLDLFGRLHDDKYYRAYNIYNCHV